MPRTLLVGDWPVSLIDRGAGPPLVFLHGATQDRSVWSRQIKYFQASHRTIAFDMRGHGQTPLGPTIENGETVLSLDALGRDCLAIMDKLRVERAVLCGVSLGGMVALDVAARAPERVEALVLANTPLALSLSPRVLTVIDWLNPYTVLVPLLRWVEPERVAKIGTRIARVVFGPGWARGEGTRRFVRAFGRMKPKALIETYRAICEARLPQLSRITCPILVVTGHDEANMIFRHAAEIARGVGTAELATIPGGHVSNLDSPDAFNRTLDAFFVRWLHQPSALLPVPSVLSPNTSPSDATGPAPRSTAKASTGSIRPS